MRVQRVLGNKLRNSLKALREVKNVWDISFFESWGVNAMIYSKTVKAFMPNEEHRDRWTLFASSDIAGMPCERAGSESRVRLSQ